MKRMRDRWEKFGRNSLEIFAWILGIILLPLIVTILALFFVWKYGILAVVVKFFKPKVLKVLNSRDAFYASDEFWGNPRSSLGLIVILNGNVSIESIREEFTKKVLEATGKSGEKCFAKLMQIPISFGGYYFWHQANYFQIHEHIRQSDQCIDDVAGLKKCAATVMTLTFPNRRPLWEVLVYSNYKSKCSALFIRMHHALTDADGLMSVLGALAGDCRIEDVSLMTSIKSAKSEENFSTLQKVREFLKLPKSVYTFCRSFFTILKTSSNGRNTNSDDGVVSWNEMQEVSFQKVVKTQTVHFSSVGLSAYFGALHSGESGLNISDQTKLLTLYPLAVPGADSLESVGNSHGLTFTKDNEESNSNSICLLKEINSQIEKSLENKQPQVSRALLSILSLFPRHFLRFVTFTWFQGGTFVFQEFSSKIVSSASQNAQSYEDSSLDLISIREHEILDLIPLCGLQWPHTAVTAAMARYQGKVTMSLMVNSNFITSSEKQTTVDNLVLKLSPEIDQIFEDGQDENGFISIPIT